MASQPQPSGPVLTPLSWTLISLLPLIWHCLQSPHSLFSTQPASLLCCFGLRYSRSFPSLDLPKIPFGPPNVYYLLSLLQDKCCWMSTTHPTKRAVSSEVCAWVRQQPVLGMPSCTPYSGNLALRVKSFVFWVCIFGICSLDMSIHLCLHS